MSNDSVVIDQRESLARARGEQMPTSPGPLVPRKKAESAEKPPANGSEGGKTRKTPPQSSASVAPRGDAPAKGGKGDKGGKTPQKGDKAKGDKGEKNPSKGRDEKPKKKATESTKRGEPGTRGMIGRIIELVCDATEKKPISKGKLYDTLKREYDSKTEKQIMAWINYFPGYADQAGHTIKSKGRGADRVYWGEANTHKPHGRRFGKKAKPDKEEKKPAKKAKK